MIHQLATRYHRKGALILFGIFYLELVLPNIANAMSERRFTTVVDRGYSSYGFPRNKSESGPVSDHKISGQSFKQFEGKFTPDKASKVNIGGPGQPEMSSFKSVNSNEMVDLFSGDFSYNIPLMDVGGYPIGLHYNSNVSMDQEASWVGLGWNINPGTINRSMRGLPDDFDGTDTIAKIQSVKDNRTVGVSVNPDLEVLGFPKGLGATLGIFHNNYNGWGLETGVNASINSAIGSKGSLTASLGITSNTQNGLSVSPSFGVSLAGSDQDETARSVSLGLNTNYNSRAGMSALQLSAEFRMQQRQSKDQENNSKVLIGSSVPAGATISFSTPSYTPSITMPFTSTQYYFAAKIGSEHVGFHPSPIPISGYISTQTIADKDKHQYVPATGYLYLTNSTERPNVLQDFNREKELPFNDKTTPHLAIPQYTYDVYSISGEGTGGMFRPYRGDVGYIRDYAVRSKSDNHRFSVDLGFGQIFHGGVDFSTTDTRTENSGWNNQNDINRYIKFGKSDSNYQSVYFRNPGEMTSNSMDYYSSVGDDNLVRVKLTGDRDQVKAGNSLLAFKNGIQTSEIPVTSSLVKKQRDKRSQVISYLTATDAQLYGLNKNIVSYAENTIPMSGCTDNATSFPRVDDKRKGHHLSEITVLNGDGRRYVYGLPAYNIEQDDVSFAVDKETDAQNLAKGLTSYTNNVENSTSNKKGKDGLYNRETIPAYAHSFLLTGIVSPDYVDVKADGITQDDIGDAVKFNYTRVYGNNGDYFAWRTPSDNLKANYNEGLKSYKRDDKASYIYGKKEVWYLNSIESKSVIAVFKINSDRQDIYSVAGETGGLDRTKSLRRLDSILLYAKADLVKHGANAKPIKTVIFRYSYKLCKGITGDANVGKLTLDSLWFSYNGNYKGKLNPYVFKYHGTDTSYNPGYQQKCYDRWGNFKYPTNPGGLSNVDYPYTEQNKSRADKYAQAWTMDEILLPSGGRIKATYEADDYAYVQNRRAQQFFSLAGISNSPNDTGDSSLYSVNGNSWTDNNYVFINSAIPLASKQDLYEKYLRGINYLYFKLSVTVPTDKWGGGKEIIPVYGQIDGFDLVNSQKFWIRLKTVDNGQGALARSVIQFLRLNLPSKAYPMSEPGDDVTPLDAVKLLAASFKGVRDGFRDYNNVARLSRKCQSVDLTQSFIRLDCPGYKKLGGGLRVKRIEVFDNWNQMTAQRESVYGQDYNYTTSEKLNGKDVVISSGVASYEPLVGAEENPFREPIPYAEKLAPLAPVNNLFSEEPLGESYYPSASVGYSKVRVRTINTKAKSANGWAETEYFTTKDFPTVVENTIIDPSSKKRFNPALNNFLRINSKHYLTLSQGFKIDLNDMSGKIKAQASYAETDSLHPISFTRNFYKVDNDTAFQKHLNNTVWVVDSINGHINKGGIIGKDIEVIQDMREQTSSTIANNRQANLDVLPGIGFIPFIPVPTAYPFPQKEENRFRSAVTVKVIQRYGILDSVVVMDKGSIVSTKNLLYDGETGQVLLSRTNNEFNDPVYNFSYPAHWAYSGMGMAYKNIDDVFTGLRLIKGKLYYGSGSVTPFPVERFFESGDEVQLKGEVKTMLGGANCLQFYVNPLGISTPSIRLPVKAWVIDAAKAKEGDRGLYFIDANGRTITGKVDFMRVLRSGKRNMLDASAGSIISLANPIREVSSGNFKLVIDSTTHILNTSAVTYKDHWKVENSLYARDTIYTVTTSHSTYRLPGKDSVINAKLQYRGNSSLSQINSINSTIYQKPSAYMAASYNRVKYTQCASSGYFYIKSMETYDLSGIPTNALITSATMYLTPVTPNNLWYKIKLSGGLGCGPNYSTDWAGLNSYYGGNSLAYFKRITAPWNEQTPYRFIKTTEANKVPVNYNAYDLNCTNLVQDIISSGSNYGFVLELNKQDTNKNVTESNWLSFQGQVPSYEGGLIYGPGLDINYTISEDSIGTLCKQNISDTLANPYRWGMLGNWRVDRAYTYYHDRKESDASSSSTNIRKDGELKAFTPFWKFTDSVLLQKADTAKWIWNSASSLYNKKGYEIENYDPLGRFNAGLYGYDQTLPIAVAQNSKYREILYDGFEDYNYKTKQCLTCPNDRDIDFVKDQSGVSLDSTQSHTGNYSIKVLANSQSSLTASVLPVETADSVSFRVDSTAIYTTSVPGVGSGLTGYYKGFPISSCSFLPSGFQTFLDTVQNQSPLDYSWGATAPVSGLCQNWYTVNWKGKIQAPFTDNYHFYGISDRIVEVYVNGVKVVSTTTPNVEGSGVAVNLTQGALYTIEIKYSHTLGSNAYVRLRWSGDNTTNGIEAIPQSYLYKDNMVAADSAGSVKSSVDHWCISPYNAGAANSIRPKFSPVAGQKIVVSGWVKMDGNDCNTAPALDNVLVATVQGTSTQTVPLSRTGVRIEGWQRYEAMLTVSAGATSFHLNAIAPSGRNIYVDDIRVQPFSSQMKSYAYDQSTLRLMAELDENNYATLYEYDDDGTLIRVKKETERGVMTVKESRSALLKQ
jgi:hypothetical protein